MCDYKSTKKKFEKEIEDIYDWGDLEDLTNVFLKYSQIKVNDGFDSKGNQIEVPFFEMMRRKYAK